MISPTSQPDPGDETGASAEAEEGIQRMLGNISFMVWERKWYAIATFLVIVLAAGAYAYLTPRVYQGVATVQVLKHGPQVLRVADVVDNNITSESDLNTEIKVLESVAIIQNVVARLTPDEVKLLPDAGSRSSAEPPSPVEVIYRGRKIVLQRLSLIVAIQFQHPNPRIAARVANLLATEYIAYNTRLRVEESMKAVDELKDRADQQRKRVDDLANALQGFRQRGNLISLVQSKDIVTEKLKALNMMTTQTNARLKESEVRWNQVQEWTKAGGDLSELPFIASQPKVAPLVQQVTTLKLAFAQVTERYKPKHPRWIEAANALIKARAELKLALTAAAASIKSEYENAAQNDDASRKALADQEARSLEMDKSGVEYENLERDLRINEQLLESMIVRMRETSVSSSIETESARIIDRAIESSKPVSPNLRLILASGLFGGLLLGGGLALGIAMLRDGIKTPFQIEHRLQLPLLGVIPRVKSKALPDRAQIVADGSSRAITEAFLSLYSALRLTAEGREARLLLVTSTLPGEGKSFVATNLALTFAAQGFHTAVVDCDLRRPNLQQSFGLATPTGVVQVCQEGARLGDVVAKNVHPNLDVIIAGGQAKNPIQLFNSPAFAGLVAELAQRYDRVVFDSPPVAAVSDALSLLPHMHGWIYTVRYSQVKLQAAQQGVRRLQSIAVPALGAVLNDAGTGASSDYFTGQPGTTVKKYYEPPARVDDEVPIRR